MIKKFLLIPFYLILFIEIGHTLEFYGNFIQGHFIVGKTEPNSRVIIDKKKIKVSKDGYFVFGLDRDRKYDVTIKLINSGINK